MEHNHTGFMETQELEKQKMDVLREMAECNMLIGSLRAEIEKLKKDKEEFLLLRENEVAGRIHKLLNNSRILFQETESNYKTVQEFYSLLRELLGRELEATK